MVHLEPLLKEEAGEGGEKDERNMIEIPVLVCLVPHGVTIGGMYIVHMFVNVCVWRVCVHALLCLCT